MSRRLLLTFIALLICCPVHARGRRADYNDINLPTSFQSPAIRDLAYRIKSDADVEISHRVAERDSDMNRIESELNHTITSTPKYITNRNGPDFPNPDYDIIVQQARDEASVKMRAAERRFEESLTVIKRGEMERLNAINVLPSQFNNQLNTTSGSIGLVKQGTGVYVRNYMTFPNRSESDLYARPVTPLNAPPAFKYQAPPHTVAHPTRRTNAP